jgi:hypothetical protein
MDADTPARVRAQVWLQEHEAQLLGRRLDELLEEIKRAGLEVRDLRGESAWMTQDLQYNRINLWLDEDERVTRAWAG